jgi:membrane peptidoglycan carboxypeptidase
MPLSRKTRILVRRAGVLAGIAVGSVTILVLYGTALVDQALAAAPLPRGAHHLRAPFAALFVDYLRANTRSTGDVASMLDVDLQQAVQEGRGAELQELERRYSHLRALARSGDALQVAVVVLTLDGRLLAMQGGRSGLRGEFNGAAIARHQVGSLVKPFMVGGAFQAGWPGSSVPPDEPLVVPVDRRFWGPENNDGRYRGSVTVHGALMLSLNVRTVRLGLDVSVPGVADTLRHAGLSGWNEGPAILLGALGASPLEVARAYESFLAQGQRKLVSPERGTAGAPEAVFHPAVASGVRAILEDVPRRGTAAAQAGLVSGHLAAKAGTTDERRALWTVALRPRMVTVVWVGTDGNSETGRYGPTGALENWRRIDARMPPVWQRGDL